MKLHRSSERQTPAKLLRSLRDLRDEVTLEREIAEAAKQSLDRMIAIGTPTPTAE